MENIKIKQIQHNFFLDETIGLGEDNKIYVYTVIPFKRTWKTLFKNNIVNFHWVLKE